MEESPNDLLLISKVGKALVDCHYFRRAVNYYKEAIERNNDRKLKLKLAELYMNLKQFEDGEAILMNDLDDKRVTSLEDLNYMQYKTEMLIMLSEIRERSGNLTLSLKSLKDAFENQIRLKKRMDLKNKGKCYGDCVIYDQVNQFKIILSLVHVPFTSFWW